MAVTNNVETLSVFSVNQCKQKKKTKQDINSVSLVVILIKHKANIHQFG